MKKVLDIVFPKERAARLVAAAGKVPVACEELKNHALTKRLRMYNEAVGLDSSCWEAYLGRAKTLIALGRSPESLKDLRKAHELHPEETEVARLLLKHEERREEETGEEEEDEDDWW